MNIRAILHVLTLSGLALAGALSSPKQVMAQSCTADELGAAVDQAGARLRDIMAANQPNIDARIKTLSAKRGWAEPGATEQALGAITDARTDALDRTANELLARIDTLGALPANTAPECGRIQELEASSLELQAAVKAKSTYVLARLDAAITEAPKPPDTKQAETKLPDAKPVDLKPEAPKVQPLVVQPSVVTASPLKPRTPDQPWSTTTTAEAPQVIAPPQPPPQTAVQAPIPLTPQSAADEGYTREEIVRASSGFFGQVSANIAAAVERSFSATGKPTAYILGEEGGGAFLAGLRYGKGTLYLSTGGTMPVYWHGPSLGVDFGAAGSKVMFLVYRLREPDQLLPTFSSLDGQAYVAGGIGVTVMSNGDVQMAPFRAGVGLRLGASVGYVRFTRRPTWNPF